MAVGRRVAERRPGEERITTARTYSDPLASEMFPGSGLLLVHRRGGGWRIHPTDDGRTPSGPLLAETDSKEAARLRCVDLLHKRPEFQRRRSDGWSFQSGRGWIRSAPD